MTSPRKPAKATPRKASSRKPAAKRPVRKSRAFIMEKGKPETMREIEPGITGDQPLTGRESLLGYIEAPITAPCLTNEDLCAVQRLLDNGHFNDVDAAVAKVRELRYGWQAPSVTCTISDKAFNDACASASAAVEQLNKSAASAVNLSASCSWNGDNSLNPVPPLPIDPLDRIEQARKAYIQAAAELREAAADVLYRPLPR